MAVRMLMKVHAPYRRKAGAIPSLLSTQWEIDRLQLKIGKSLATGGDRGDIAFMAEKWRAMKAGAVAPGFYGKMSQLERIEWRIGAAYLQGKGDNACFLAEERSRLIAAGAR